MLPYEQQHLRDELLELHRKLVAQYEALRLISCEDEDFNQLLRSIQTLVGRSADLVAETASVYLPIESTGLQSRT